MTRRLLFLLHAGFVLTGIMTTFIGPLLPAFSERWSLSDFQSGNFFTAQFLGSILGVVLSGIINHRSGFKVSIALGFAMMCAAAAALIGCSWSVGLVAIFCNGIGLGLVIPSTNLLVAQTTHGNPSSALNLLNFSWGLGATACPFVVIRLLRLGGLTALLTTLAAAAALLVVIFGLGPSFRGHRRETLTSNPRPASTAPLILLLGSLFFLYLGVESCIGGWLASYARRMVTESGSFWMMSPSFFWGALLLGRAAAPSILKGISEIKLARLGLMVALCGIWILLRANSAATIIAGASLAGLGLAPVYPITIARLSQEFGSDSPRLGGVMFALAGLGGATLPWLVGFLSTRFASLKVGLTLPLLGDAIMIVVYFLPARSTGSRTLKLSAVDADS